EFAEAKIQYAEWLEVYKAVAPGSMPGKLVEAVEQIGDAVPERGEVLIALDKQAASGEELAEARRALAIAESLLLRVMNRTVRQELDKLNAQKAAVAESVDRAGQLSLLGACIVLVLAVVLGIGVARTLARPIIRLSDDVRVVGRGNLAHRTSVSTRDEIGLLARAFNRMTERLERTTVSKRYMDNVITSMVDALIVTDPDGVIRTVNRAALELFGYAERDLIGAPIERLIRKDAPAPAPLTRPWLEGVIERGPVSNLETVCVARDARVIPVLVSASPLIDESGAVKGVVCVALDITERKRAEEALARAQQQLIQSEKLAALGRFASGIAHEVKNPLGIVLGGIESLETDLPASEDTATTLGLMKNSVLRADAIVKDLLKFARPSAAKKEAMDPAQLVAEAVELVRHGGAFKRIQTKTDFTHGAARLEADKNQLQQVMLNVIMNAVDAMPQGGSLTVKTALELGQDSRRMVLIEVADTGEGIPEEHLPRLFEPFFTTKRERKGTGLGLSISSTIVEGHGGTIVIASQVGKGTTVRIALPAQMGGQEG
ncbi:MAG TPA: ATP-binding protein, partial [Nitrospiraceae bacterium]